MSRGSDGSSGTGNGVRGSVPRVSGVRGRCLDGSHAQVETKASQPLPIPRILRLFPPRWSLRRIIFQNHKIGPAPRHKQSCNGPCLSCDFGFLRPSPLFCRSTSIRGSRR